MPATFTSVLRLLLPVLLASNAFGGPVTGRVEGAAGPVGGARITALRLSTPWSAERLSSPDALRAFVRTASLSAQVVASAKTSSDGRFALTLPSNIRVGLWVDAGERGQAIVDEVSAANLVVALGPATLLEGDSIVRGAPNYPYPEVRKGISVVALHTRLPLVLRAQTDAEGAFKLGYGPEGDYLVVGAAANLMPELATLHLPVPLPPAPAPRQRVEPADAGPDDEALGLSNELWPPSRTLGLPDSSYHRHGQLFFDFMNSVSMVGVVTNHGKPASNLQVRLAGSGAIRAQQTDAAGRFHFADTVEGQSYGLEVTVGNRALRQCIQLVSQVGGSFCCASPPGAVTAQLGQARVCRFRIAVGQPLPLPKGEEAGQCFCDEAVLDAFAPDAGVTP